MSERRSRLLFAVAALALLLCSACQVTIAVGVDAKQNGSGVVRAGVGLDDDVRFDRPGLERVVDLLATHHLVRPQNYFSPLPWHALWDTARTLINRAPGPDYPGTLAVRRSKSVPFFRQHC